MKTNQPYHTHNQPAPHPLPNIIPTRKVKVVLFRGGGLKERRINKKVRQERKVLHILKITILHIIVAYMLPLIKVSVCRGGRGDTLS